MRATPSDKITLERGEPDLVAAEHKDRGECGDEALGKWVEQNRLYDTCGVAIALRDGGIARLAKVARAMADEGVLEFARSCPREVVEFGHVDVEEPKEFEKLLRGEGATGALDFAEPALRQTQTVRQVTLGPLSGLSELAHFVGDDPPGVVELR